MLAQFFRRIRILFVSIPVILPTFAVPLPAWAAWPAGGVRASDQLTTPLVSHFTSCADGAGGLFTFWCETRSGSIGVYVSHLLPDGTFDPGWPAGGKPLARPIATEAILFATPDGTGGAYISRSQMWLGQDDSLVVHRMSPTGETAAGWPDAGVPISSIVSAKLPAIAGDGLGGAVVSWYDWRSGDRWEPYVMRVLPDASIPPGWPVDGLLLRANEGADDQLAFWSRERPRVVADAVGGFFIAWPESLGGFNDLLIQHVDGSGAVAPGWPAGGRSVCDVNSHKMPGGFCVDGVGGSFIAWTETRAGQASAFLQRIDANGSNASGWPAGGHIPVMPLLYQSAGDLLADGAGGAFFSFSQVADLSTWSDLHLTRVTASGDIAAGWPTAGVTVAATELNDWLNLLASDGGGGVYLAGRMHEVLGSERGQIALTRVTADGQLAPGWPNGVLAVTPFRQDAWPEEFVADGAGGAIVTWSEPGISPPQRYAYRVAPQVPTGAPPRALPAQAGLHASPNPSSDVVDLRLALPRAGRVSVEVLDLSGRQVREIANAAFPAGLLPLRWDGRDALGNPAAAGVYWVRARGEDLDLRRRIVRVN